MTDARAWLDARTPAPPGELRAEIEEASRTGAVDGLTEAARTRLAAALARPGRVRESAFELLAADALATYAAEAALDAEDPARELVALARRLLDPVAAP